MSAASIGWLWLGAAIAALAGLFYEVRPGRLRRPDPGVEVRCAALLAISLICATVALVSFYVGSTS